MKGWQIIECAQILELFIIKALVTSRRCGAYVYSFIVLRLDELYMHILFVEYRNVLPVERG